LPSVQWVIRVSFTASQLTIAGINQSSSASWLTNYASQRGISYPFVYDSQGKMHKDYQVGTSYGNAPPTFIIIDQQGVVRYRIDDKFNKAEEMRAFIQNLLK